MYTPNKILSIFLIFCLLFTQSLYALPQDPEVVEGQASFDYSTPDKLQVTASSEKTIINYASFNIAQNEWVNFILPSVTASILNRVIGNISSEILGKLTSNQGTLMLVNTAGINIAKDALIQAGGNLVLSTLDIPNQDFLSNHYIFERTQDPASIKNMGNLFTQDYLAILTSTFENSGTIQAKAITIAGADKLSLQLDPYIELIVDKPLSSNPNNLDDQIKNTGSIESTDGRVYIEAQALPSLFKNAINTTGIIRATAVTRENNEIVLVSQEPILAAGTFQVHDGNLKLKTKTHLTMGAVFDISGSNLITDPEDDITILGGAVYAAGTTVNEPGNITVSLGLLGETTVTGLGALTLNADSDASGAGDFSMDAGTIINTAGTLTITGVNVTVNQLTSVTTINMTAANPAGILTINGNININGPALSVDTWNYGGNFTQTIGTTITANDHAFTLNKTNGIGITTVGVINDGTGTLSFSNDFAGSMVSNGSLLTANTISLRSGDPIGAFGNSINTITNNLSAMSTGGIYITNTGALNLSAYVTGVGNPINIVNNGNVSLIDPTWAGQAGSLQANAGDIILTATPAGSITDGTLLPASSNIINAAGGNATLISDTGVIGTQLLPIKINIAGGTMSISPAGQVGGVSAALQGVIAPINQVTLLNTPPGTVFYNGAVIYSPGGGEEPESEAPQETVIPTNIINETITSSLTCSDTQDPVAQTNQDYSSNILFPQDYFPFDSVTVEFAGYEMYVYCSQGQVYVIPLDSQGNPIRKEQRVIRAKPQLINLSTYQLTNPYDFTQIPYLSK
ncbi:MAG: filamentous hemagglutinin N-terminal domain-containing protein [Candidatus Omnitrophota bacterium]